MHFRRPHLLAAVASAATISLASAAVCPDAAADADSAAPAQQPSSPELQAGVRAIATDRGLAGASVGIAVLDVDSGRLLAAVNEHFPLNPASNAKLYTAGAALAILHGEYRYETTLSGKLEGDAVTGPLVLRGYGDPSLGTSDLWAMIEELKAYGVRRVTGDVVVDQHFFDEQTTPPAYDQQPNEWSGFRAPVSAVAINENCLILTVRPGLSAGVGGAAHVEFDPPGFVDVGGAVKSAEVGTADNVALTLEGVPGGRMAAHVSGAIAIDSRLVRYTRRAEDPRLLAGYALKALLEKADIKVSGEVTLMPVAAVASGRPPPGRGRILAKHASAPLSSLLYNLGKLSDNFYAEMIFRSLGGEARGRPAKSLDATEVVAEWLARIGVSDTGMSFRNGSGLFDADRVTASSTVGLLRWAWREPDVQAEFVAQLSTGGVDGTLRKRFRAPATKRRVRAKTGTLDDAIALSGYVMGEDGHGPLAFSILFNRVAGKQDVARRAADRIVELLARPRHAP